MNSPFGIAGPPPPPDGLRRAFRDADRRRARRLAVFTVAPVVLAFAAATSLPHGTSPTRLTVTDGPSTGASAFASDEPSPIPGESATPDPAVTSPEPSPSYQPGGEPSPTWDPGTPAPSDPPDPEESPRATWRFHVDGSGSGKADFTLTQPVEIDLNEATSSGGGDYTGLVLAQGSTVVGGIARIPYVDEDWPYWWSLNDETRLHLDAGSYTAYLLADAPTQIDLEATVARGAAPAPVALSISGSFDPTFLKAEQAIAATEEATVRVSAGAGPRTLAFVVSGYRTNGVSANVDIEVCLPRADAECAAGDPRQATDGFGAGRADQLRYYQFLTVLPGDAADGPRDATTTVTTTASGTSSEIRLAYLGFEW